MPRIAENREPALPSSQGQKDRYRRILRAAALHGAQHGLERMQMIDVAKDAGVAIGTLYRYFPSKTILFTALLHSQVEQLDRVSVATKPGEAPADAVSRVLIAAARQLFQHPLLAQAMLQANNATVASDHASMAVTGTFADLILRVAGVEEPTEHDIRLVRLTEQTWYGVLISRLNGLVDDEEAETDTVLACRLLLTDLGSPA